MDVMGEGEEPMGREGGGNISSSNGFCEFMPRRRKPPPPPPRPWFSPLAFYLGLSRLVHPEGIGGGGEGVAEKTISPILPSPLLPIFPLFPLGRKVCAASVQYTAQCSPGGGIYTGDKKEAWLRERAGWPGEEEEEELLQRNFFGCGI